MILLPKMELTAASLKLIAAVGCALLLALLIHDRNHWKAKTAHYAGQLAAERSAHAATVANFRAAAERARLADAANTARVKSEQADINERIAHDLESRLAAARAVAQRLRGTVRTGADSGRRRGAPVPAVPAAAQGTPEAAPENGLPESDRLTATEQAIQLDELIQWVRAQAALDVSGSEGR